MHQYSNYMDPRRGRKGERAWKIFEEIIVKGTWNILQDNHILGHESSLSKFKRIEIILSISFKHNTMRLEINCRGKKSCKKHKHIEAK